MGNRIDVGSFNTVLTLRQMTTSRNASGQFVESFSNGFKFFAKVEELSSSEKEVADKEVLLNKIKITTYYSPALKNTERLMYEDTEYEIVGTAKMNNTYIIIDAVKVF